jgi:dolichyl-phosphate-mannose--protein O-mannosyl transferase
MNTSVMMERIAQTSPRPRARITGVVYLLYFLTAVLGEFLLRGLVVDGDAAATANNLLAHQPLFRLGWATGLISTACYIAVTALFYSLFKPVNRSLSLVAAFLSLSGCTILASLASFNSPPCSSWEAART